MKLETSNPAFIRDLFHIVGALVEEACFTFYPDKITLVTMDPSHTALLDIEVPAENFEIYDCPEARTLCFNVVEACNTVFRSNAKNLDATLTIELEEEKGRLLFLYRDNLPRYKRIPLIEVQDEEIPEPRIFYKATARIVTEAFRSILKDFCRYQYFSVKVSEDRISFGSSDEIAAEDTPLNKGNDALLDLKYSDTEPHQLANLPVSYVSSFLNQVYKVSEVLSISISTDMPIKIEAEIWRGHIWFFAAPAINGSYMGAEWVNWTPVPTLHNPVEVIYRCGQCGATMSKEDAVCPKCNASAEQKQSNQESIDGYYDKLRSLIDPKYLISIQDTDSLGNPVVTIKPAAGWASHPWVNFEGVTVIDALKRAITKMQNPGMDYTDLKGQIWPAEDESIYYEGHIRLFLADLSTPEPGMPMNEPEPPAEPTPTGYTCEECGTHILDGHEIRLEDGSINCVNCAPEDILTQHQRYLRYLAEETAKIAA